VRRLQGLAALVDDLFGDGTGLDQGQAAVELALGKFRLGARIRELTVRLLGDGLKRPGIDDIEKIAGFDECPVTKLHAGDEAADPRANLDLFHRLEPSGEFVPIRNGAFGWLCDRDRRSSDGLRRRLVTAADKVTASRTSTGPRLRLTRPWQKRILEAIV